MRFDLRGRLQQDKPFYFIWATMPGSVLAGQLARLPYEGVCIDMQHGLSGFGDVVTMVPEIIANCTFGGPNKDRLFIAASSSVYVITLNTQGIQKP